ncbi:MAG: hypothetical protein WCC38_02320, partial [Pseudonocardiaceae bacterium]
ADSFTVRRDPMVGARTAHRGKDRQAMHHQGARPTPDRIADRIRQQGRLRRRWPPVNIVTNGRCLKNCPE